MADEDKVPSETEPGDSLKGSWNDHVAHLRESFIDALVARGLRLVTDDSSGSESNATLTDGRVTVMLQAGFPYRPPEVRRDVPGPRSWHLDNRGQLCLYTSRDHDKLPWLDPDAFLARIDEWFEKTEASWPGDPPILDLEAYLNLPIDPRYVMYHNLDEYTGDYARFSADAQQIRLVDGKRVPKKSTRGYLSGYVTDIGAVDQPPVDWETLIENSAQPDRIRGAIDRRRVDVLLFRYQRLGGRERHAGVLAITLKPTSTGGPPRPHLAPSGSVDDAAMRLRSGPTTEALERKKVYVVGAGALGSHICDGLSRAGLGRMTIRDDQILTASNMTRHLVSTLTFAGVPKAQAVEVYLTHRAYNRTQIECNVESLRSPAEASAILKDCDLVVDATADGSVTSMLEDAVRHVGARFVAACLKNDGTTLRIDVIPPFDNASPLPPSPHRSSSLPEVFEAGCGDPVSPTPPHAVAEAAAMAVRHIIGILVDAPLGAAGEERDVP